MDWSINQSICLISASLQNLCLVVLIIQTSLLLQSYYKNKSSKNNALSKNKDTGPHRVDRTYPKSHCWDWNGPYTSETVTTKFLVYNHTIFTLGLLSFSWVCVLDTPTVTGVGVLSAIPGGGYPLQGVDRGEAALPHMTHHVAPWCKRRLVPSSDSFIARRNLTLLSDV